MNKHTAEVKNSVGVDHIVKRPDEPSGNVSRVFEPENVTASDEELTKQVQSKMQELSQLLSSRGDGLGPQVDHARNMYMQATDSLLKALQGGTPPNPKTPR